MMVLAAVVAAVVRAGAFLAMMGVSHWLAGWASGPGGANIGFGLLVFAVVAVVAGLWATWDGWRTGFGRTAAVWSVVGVVTGVAAAVLAQLPRALNAEVLAADLASLAPFVAGLVIVPALLGALVGWALRQDRQPRAV